MNPAELDTPTQGLDAAAADAWLGLEPLVRGWTESALAFLPRFLLALLLLASTVALAGMVARMLERRLDQRGVDPGLGLVLARLTRWSLVVVGTIVALDQIDFDVTTFLTGLGVVGFTLGFAFQDISKNFVAGLLLLIQQPFRLGDLIQVAGYTGVVEAIDLRATSLRTNDGTTVLIPNGDVFTSALLNYTSRSTRRVDLALGVAYDSDLEQVRRVSTEALRGLSEVLPEPAPDLVFHDFGSSSIDLTLRFWAGSSQREHLTARDRAIVAIHRAFAAEGIEIPFPVQVLQFPDGPSTPPRAG